MFCVRRIYAFIFTALILFTAVMTGCGSAAQTEKANSINYGLYLEPASLDPAKAADSAGKQLANAIFEGLLRQKPDGSYENAMAIDWISDETGSKYTFKIRNAIWAYGEKITADDFVFAWKRVLDPQTKSPYAYLFYNIKNAQGYNRNEDAAYSGKKAAADEVAIYAADEATLLIELEKPDPAFYKRLNNPVFFPLPQKKIEELGEDFFSAENIAGNGPFMLAEHSPGKKYILQKNADYWDADTVALEYIYCYINAREQDNWQLFKTGQIDLTLQIPQKELAEGLKNGEISTSPLLANYYYQFNLTKKPLSDKKVRQALSLALDRTKMVESLLQGGQKKAGGLIPYGSYEQFEDNNIEEAKKLLLEAGYKSDNLEVEMLVENDESHLYLAAFLKEEWESKLGIKVKIVPLFWQEKIARVQAREYDLVSLGWAADYADTAEFLERYVFRLGQNNSGWSNSEYDELVKKARENRDEKERSELLKQAELILIEDLPVLPLYDYARVFAASDKIQGLYFPPAGVEVEFKWAQAVKSN